MSTLTAERLRADVAAALDCPPAEVDAEADLQDLGLDSLRVMGLVEKWRGAGASDLEFADLAEDPRLVAWNARLVRS
ncbi:hypothetical protein GCM10010124_30750 [Pilimelia terevasa]|uniref:Carrier domain-containing protein n=1 Tax=Pilimelia terevasa TaxID=53372 RepID=A0A8J3FK21_9ACTN|nr:phosphopantetheine-binding protein [Pilimelia terevasa]GGK35930.1 hypothetical protein GCM10010124_30750 [Pilimelia terevasa]